MEVTFWVSNEFNPFISFNFLHWLNKPSILVTFEVLKLDKSKDCNSLHSLNITNKLVTLLVLNFSKPLISFKL